MNKKYISIIMVIIALIIAVGGYFIINNNSKPETSNNTSDQVANTIDENSKILVTYFSVPETDEADNMTSDEDNSTVVVDGEVLGNTQYVATLIKTKTNSDIVRLEPQDPYPTNHDDLLERASEEMNSDETVELATTIDNFDDYDVIFVGYPIWNADIPPVIDTFLESYDFNNKTVIPFSTHGGSGLAGTPETIANKLTNANVITNAFTLSRNNMENAPSAVENWLQEINIVK